MMIIIKSIIFRLFNSSKMLSSNATMGVVYTVTVVLFNLDQIQSLL